MTIENIQRWTIPPNWRTPLIERLDWLTAVLGSPTGAEQRFALRQSPRRSFEFLVTAHRTSRTLFDLAIGRVGVDPWYLPLWHDVQTIGEPTLIGATSLDIDTVNRQFVVGGFAVIFSAAVADDIAAGGEVVEITAVSPTSITIEPTTRLWGANARIYPCMKARLSAQPQMDRIGGRTSEGQVRLEVIGPNDWHGAADASPEYLGNPVLTEAPNSILDVNTQYERLFDEQDNSIGVAERAHTSDIGFTVRGYHWTALGRAEHQALIALLYRLDGRNNPVWVPTFDDDFILAAEVTSGDTALEVEACGFTYFGGPREGRQDLQIVLRDGTIIHRGITGASLTIDGTESLVVDSALPDIALRDVLRISFMSLCRLDSDTVEIEHITDIDGVAQVAVNFRTAPEVRTAANFTVAPYGDVVQNDSPCGVECIPTVDLVGDGVSVYEGAVSYPTLLSYVASPLELEGFAIAYVADDDGGDVRLRMVNDVGSLLTEVSPSGVAATQGARLAGGLIPMTFFNDGTLYGVVVSDLSASNNVALFDNLDGSLLNGPETFTSNEVLVAMGQAASNCAQIVSLDVSADLTFESHTFGGGFAPTTADSGDVTKAGCYDHPDLFAGGIGVWLKDDRLYVAGISFFTSALVGTAATLSDDLDISNTERLVCIGRSGVDGNYHAVWRETTGSGPSGRVRSRVALPDNSTMLDVVDLHPLSAMTASGVTHRSNREPIAGATLNNGYIVLVERRYDSVGSNVRAYETLTVCDAVDGQDATPVRLWAAGTGPLGDVTRSASVAVSYEGEDEYVAEVVVAFEKPLDDDGNTELVVQRYAINMCRPTTKRIE